jgi:N utilization substance protein B
VGTRTRARECALQALYQLDLSGGDPREALRGILAHFEEADKETEQFADELVRGVQSERRAIDELIQKSSTNWKLDRMARVDRNILRLAVYEILRRADVPLRVSLNEAIELGKKFGSEESSAFVNGVLDRIAHQALPDATPKLDKKA